MAVNITQEDVQVLLQRLGASEERMREMQTRIEAQSVELAASNTRHNQLIMELRGLFERQAAEFAKLQTAQRELEEQATIQVRDKTIN